MTLPRTGSSRTSESRSDRPPLGAQEPRDPDHERDGDAGDHGVVRAEQVPGSQQHPGRRGQGVLLPGVQPAELRQDDREQADHGRDGEQRHHRGVGQRRLELLAHLVLALEQGADPGEHAREIARRLAGAEQVDRVRGEHLRMSRQPGRQRLAGLDLGEDVGQHLAHLQAVALPRDPVERGREGHLGARHDRELGEEEHPVAVADLARTRRHLDRSARPVALDVREPGRGPPRRESPHRSVGRAPAGPRVGAPIPSRMRRSRVHSVTLRISSADVIPSAALAVPSARRLLNPAARTARRSVCSSVPATTRSRSSSTTRTNSKMPMRPE